MDSRLSVSFTTAQEKNSSKQQWRLARALADRIEAEGLRLVLDLDTDQLEQRYSQLCKCQGSAVIAFSQWEGRRLFRDQTKTVILPSEFSHLATAMAVAARKPLLLLREKNVSERGSLKRGLVHPTIDIPTGVEPAWLQTPSFQKPFSQWLKQVRAHRHVFLGYSSRARSTALAVNAYLTNKLKVSVLDWHDFRPSGVIMQNIEEAEHLAMCGIFLFMADDTVGSKATQQGAPRDNVIYEAGSSREPKATPTP